MGMNFATELRSENSAAFDTPLPTVTNANELHGRVENRKLLATVGAVCCVWSQRPVNPIEPSSRGLRL